MLWSVVRASRQGRTTRWQPAEAVAFYLKSPVEACVQILERDGGGQVHQRSFIEMAAQFVEQFVGDFDRRSRHLFGISNRDTFGRREELILVVGVERGESFLAAPYPHLNCRSDIDTETT